MSHFLSHSQGKFTGGIKGLRPNWLRKIGRVSQGRAPLQGRAPPRCPTGAGSVARPAFHRDGLPALEFGLLQHHGIYAGARPLAAQDQRHLGADAALAALKIKPSDTPVAVTGTADTRDKAQLLLQSTSLGNTNVASSGLSLNTVLTDAMNEMMAEDAYLVACLMTVLARKISLRLRVVGARLSERS